MFAALLLGTGLGVLVAAQVGPVWLLCARSAARYGFGAGAMIGVGAATVDFVYAGLGALGAGAVLVQRPAASGWLGLGGAAVLAWYAVRTLRSGWRIREGLEVAGEVVTRPAALRTGLVATASNPLTILSWAAIFGGASVVAAVAGPAQALALLLGVWAGSLGWHLALSTAFGVLGRRAGPRALAGIDLASGIGLGVFAGVMAVGSVQRLTSADAG
jgi:threonine/homoserine/homoserine lactone efflux protein